MRRKLLNVIALAVIVGAGSRLGAQPEAPLDCGDGQYDCEYYNSADPNSPVYHCCVPFEFCCMYQEPEGCQIAMC